MSYGYDFVITYGLLEPITTIVGGPELFIGIGSTINLTCVVRHLPEPPNTISWGHKNQVGGRHYFVGARGEGGRMMGHMCAR